jgi:hypothetical protein
MDDVDPEAIPTKSISKWMMPTKGIFQVNDVDQRHIDCMSIGKISSNNIRQMSILITLSRPNVDWRGILEWYQSNDDYTARGILEQYQSKHVSNHVDCRH